LEKKNVSYNFAFHTGKRIEDFYITKEELDNLDKPSYEVRPFNYFRCHSEKIGKGILSTANKKGMPNKRIEMDISNQDTILMQFKDKLFENPNLYQNSTLRKDTASIIDELHEYFNKFCSYSSAQFDLSAIRQPRDAKVKGELLLKDGSNFVNVFNYYKNSDIFFKNEFDAKLKELMPIIDLTDITFEFDKLVFRVGYDKKQYTLNDLSDGMIKALILTMLINLPINNSFSLLAIDEPEMNLHPAWQKAIGKWIQTSSNFRQCFISTHSPDFLDVFTEGFKNNQVGIFVFNPQNDCLIKKLDYQYIKEDLENWELGDLYRVNDPALGGWPW
jgi:predicted ATPase